MGAALEGARGEAEAHRVVAARKMLAAEEEGARSMIFCVPLCLSRRTTSEKL